MKPAGACFLFREGFAAIGRTGRVGLEPAFLAGINREKGVLVTRTWLDVGFIRQLRGLNFLRASGGRDGLRGCLRFSGLFDSHEMCNNLSTA